MNVESLGKLNRQVVIPINGSLENTDYYYLIVFNPSKEVKIASQKNVNPVADALLPLMKAMIDKKIEAGIELNERDKEILNHINKDTYKYVDYSEDNYFTIVSSNGFPMVNKESVPNLIDATIESMGEDLFYSLNPQIIGVPTKDPNKFFDYIDASFPEGSEEEKKRKKMLEDKSIDGINSRVYLLQVEIREEGFMGIELVKLKKEIFEDPLFIKNSK